MKVARRRWLGQMGGLAGGMLAGCAAPNAASDSNAAAKPAAPPFAALPNRITPISAASGGRLPAGWAPYILRPDKRPTIYSTVRQDGRTVMHAVAAKSATAVNCDVEINPNDTPWLSWSWRADALLADSNVADGDADDSVVRVVLAFDGDINRLSYKEASFYEQVKLFTGKDLPFASIMYVWDPKLEANHMVSNFRSERIRYVIAESGAARLGQWTSYRRNVVDDYKRAFGELPGRITAVGVMTDTDDLGLTAEAWYGDLAMTAT